MPNYRHKETGEVIRVPSVRITFSEDFTETQEIDLSTGENLLENYEFVPYDGEFNVKMKRASNDGVGLR
jgi:hypothetical protein